MFVICTLHNASNNINGVAFEDHKEGKISVEAVSAEVAEVFAQIDGYKVVESKEAKAPKQNTAKANAPAAPAAPATGEGEGAGTKTPEELAAEADAAAKAEAEAKAATAKAKK